MPKIPADLLFNACFEGDAAAVSRLLPAGGTRLNLSGPRFQQPRCNGKSTPLQVAAGRGRTEIVQMLLARAPNTDVDYVDAQGVTALAVAALYHHADILRLLADNGANVNYADTQRRVTLRLAVGLISPHSPSPRDPDPDGARQLSTVRALLRLGAGTLSTPPPRALATF